MWDQSRYAWTFFVNNDIPFQDMTNENDRVTKGNWCLVEKFSGNVVVVYLHDGRTAKVDLRGLGPKQQSNSVISVRWFDPRNGGPLQVGTVGEVEFGSTQSIGEAPINRGKDWVILLRCIKGC
jgi:Putative collagen-binding domain of a collagenase